MCDGELMFPGLRHTHGPSGAVMRLQRDPLSCPQSSERFDVRTLKTTGNAKLEIVVGRCETEMA
jgi:hypothetical protein